MPFLTTTIGPEGPLADLLIALSTPRIDALKKAGLPFPKPIPIRALIDTGASCSVIDSSVVRTLGLVPTGTAQIHTQSTGNTYHTCNQYDVCIAFTIPEIKIVGVTIPVVEALLSHMGIQALLGRNVLEHCLFIYDGKRGEFTLAV